MNVLMEDEELTAVLCANDITAVGALQALKKRKGRNKRKISVISIDNIEGAQTTDPLLTTVHIPREAMAHMAVQVLHDRICMDIPKSFAWNFLAASSKETVVSLYK